MPTTARRTRNLLLALSVLSAVSLTAAAQNPNAAQSEAAPIERSQPTRQQYTQQAPQRPAVKRSQPAQGVWLSVSPDGNVTTVSATAERTELRVDRGIANVTVHHPEHGSLILVDIGGGQVDLIKDGFYTFNAQTKTVRTLVGESEAFSGTDGNQGAKPIKVKEDHALTFGGPTLKSMEFEPFQASSDLLPRSEAYAHNDGHPPAGYGYGYGYGYGPYGDGFYGGYPYYAYGFGYPWGGFYPGFGFGYYGGFGGFYGGGFRGGYGGFRGGRR